MGGTITTGQGAWCAHCWLTRAEHEALEAAQPAGADNEEIGARAEHRATGYAGVSVLVGGFRRPG